MKQIDQLGERIDWCASRLPELSDDELRLAYMANENETQAVANALCVAAGDDCKVIEDACAAAFKLTAQKLGQRASRGHAKIKAGKVPSIAQLAAICAALRAEQLEILGEAERRHVTRSGSIH